MLPGRGGGRMKNNNSEDYVLFTKSAVPKYRQAQNGIMTFSSRYRMTDA